MREADAPPRDGGPGQAYFCALTRTPQFGAAVAGVGDTNGDGFNDLVVGAPGYDDYAGVGGGAGAVLVYYGPVVGALPCPVPELVGLDDEVHLGSAVAGAGDVNGDGFGDIVAGSDSQARGESIIYLGSATGVDPSTGISLVGPAWSAFGHVVSGGGDYNADGFDDVVVGAPIADRDLGAGAVLVYFGSATGPSATADLEADVPVDTTTFGDAVADVGDVNGDGISDFMASQYNAGWVGIYYGDPAGPAPVASWSVTESRDGMWLGIELARAGDVTGDGYADVLVIGEDRAARGEAYLYCGSARGPGAAPDATLLGTDATAVLGWHAVGGGDVDGDGFDDVAISSLTDDNQNYVGLYHGSATGVSESPDIVYSGATPLSLAGTGLDISPDLSGDGLADLVVGSPGYGYLQGRVDIYPGQPRDQDEDGYPSDDDCDDLDASVHPGATELCDGIDQDCDGATDNHADGAADWYADLDGDGFGNPSAPTRACDAPTGFVADATDCNDRIADVHPGATEICDPTNLDQDCDGLADDADPDVAPATLTTWYADADGDHHGDHARPALACDPPPGFVAGGDDCDDSRADVHPGATEVCDPADTDEDCDGLRDDADPGVAPGTRATWYADADGDGFGDPAAAVQACDPLPGTAARPGDCDDQEPTVHPGAAEVCDVGATDEDCNGLADDADPGVDRATQATWYADADGDGHGDPHAPSRACAEPPGTSSTPDDCDDADPHMFDDCSDMHESARDTAGGDKPPSGCGCSTAPVPQAALWTALFALGLVGRRGRGDRPYSSFRR